MFANAFRYREVLLTIIDSKIADRLATLQNQNPANDDPAATSSVQPKAKKAGQSSNQGSQPPLSNEAITKLRQDLAEAQRSRGSLEARLQSATEELHKLEIHSSLEGKRIGELAKERDQLARGVKDRDEEVRGKAKLLDDLHHETLSLTLQLNMADEQVKQLEKENKDLVERWMKRMGEEADQMNAKTQFSDMHSKV